MPTDTEPRRRRTRLSFGDGTDLITKEEFLAWIEERVSHLAEGTLLSVRVEIDWLDDNGKTFHSC